MQLVTPTGEGTPFEQILGHRPDLLDAYRDFYGTLWDAHVLPESLLELLRLRIAQQHDCASELAIRQEGSDVDDAKLAELERWQESDAFSPLERAALTYADQIPWGHHQITDARVEAIKAEIGDSGFVAVAFAATFFDANCCLRELFGVPAAPTVVDQPASSSGVLH